MSLKHAAVLSIGLLLPGVASAQTAPAATAPMNSAPMNPAVGTPAPGALEAPAPQPMGKLHLSAALAGQSQPIRSGLTWRIFSDAPVPEGETPKPLARSDDAEPDFSLPPGNYTVHVAYGFASASKHVLLSDKENQRLSINAGALKISGVIGEAPIPTDKLVFSVYVPIGQNPEGRLVIADASPDEIIRLPEGTYHVVSTYGDSNAIMRSDLKVETGKVTQATLNHRAATVTLKLVRTEGGEAFAGTAFSVLTPGGDVIREAIGAFPSFVLAEGDYVVIARHEGQVYTREFKVSSGLDRDIDVIAK